MPVRLKKDVLLDKLNRKGWSQSDLAQELNTTSGYTSQAIHGKRNFSHGKRDKLLSLFKCKYDELFETVSRRQRTSEVKEI